MKVLDGDMVGASKIILVDVDPYPIVFVVYLCSLFCTAYFNGAFVRNGGISRDTKGYVLTIDISL